MSYILFVSLFVTGWLLWERFKPRKYDGHIFVSQQDAKTIFALELDVDPDILKTRKGITFKVVAVPEESYPQN